MASVPHISASTLSQEIPCPVRGDFIVFTCDVDAYVEHTDLHILNRSDDYAILQSENDILHFVMSNAKQECVLRLSSARPAFDSTAIWHAVTKDGNAYLVFIHYPVSGRKPIPDACKQYFIEPDFLSFLGVTIIEAYDLSQLTTLRAWQNLHHPPQPEPLFDILQQLAVSLDGLHDTGHALMRISPDNTILTKEGIKFIGIVSLDLPWNERCAHAHPPEEMATIPPECLGYLRQKPTQSQSVYQMGAMAFYLIAGALPPICEALNYEIALMPRVYETAFPIGWDEIILEALNPNPINRFKSPDAFLEALKTQLKWMLLRTSYSGNFTYDAAVDTHIGIGKRLRCPVNQDAVFMRQSQDGQRVLIVVGDGVSTSTYGSGDIASGLLIEAAHEIWYQEIENGSDLDTRYLVAKILEYANHSICQYIRDKYSDKSPTSAECMGTTALVALIDKGTLTLGSIGDSRAYIIRTDSMSCITRDHNLFTVGIVNGIPADTCAIHPHAGSLVQCLGYYEENEENESDLLSYDIYVMKLLPGDNLLLTTDGILDYIDCDVEESEKKIAQIVRHSSNAAIACLELILQANMGGGGDNCGVGILRVSDADK